MKVFFRKNLKLMLKGLLVLALLVGISTVSMLILMAFGVVYFDDGIALNTELFASFKNSWYGTAILILLQIIVTILLCFIPGTSMAIILLMQTLYEKPLAAFVITFIGVMLTSFAMYLTGRFGGYKICKKILGEKDCERASELLNNKGAIYFPLMMLFPVFPDDALVMIAGTLKMSLKWFIPSVVIGRGIGVATIIFGLSIVPFDRFTTIWHWIGFVLLCAALICAIFLLAHRFNKFMERRNAVKENAGETENV